MLKIKDLFNNNNNNNNSYNKNAVTTTILILYAFIVGIGMYYHEMWKDELRTYMLIGYTHHLLIEGDNSFIVYHSLINLFLFICYSETMFQIFHFVVIVSALFIFLRYAKINNVKKLFFTFSYFILYDYGIISRYYGFMILVIFLIVNLITKIRSSSHKTWSNNLIVILILILANHSIISTIFAASLSLYYILVILNIKKDQNNLAGSGNPGGLNKIAIILFIIGWIAILASNSLITLKNAHFVVYKNLSSAPFFMNIRSIWNSFFPIPDLNAGVNFWDSNIINFPQTYQNGYDVNSVLHYPYILTFIISLFIVIIISIKFSSKPIVLITFLFNTILYLVFLQMLKFYLIRYQGPLFLIFIYCYWLFNSEEQRVKSEYINIASFKNIAVFKKVYIISNKIFIPMLYIILFAQIFSAFYVYSMDIKYKFTLSQDAAKYIEENKLNKSHILVGSYAVSVSPISAHLHTKIFFPEINDFSYFWDPFGKISKDMPISDLYNICTNFTENKKKKVLLILSFPLFDNYSLTVYEKMLSEKTSLKLLKVFNSESIISDENYYIYECKVIK